MPWPQSQRSVNANEASATGARRCRNKNVVDFGSSNAPLLGTCQQVPPAAVAKATRGQTYLHFHGRSDQFKLRRQIYGDPWRKLARRRDDLSSTAPSHVVDVSREFGGGCSRRRTRLYTQIPANREIYRERGKILCSIAIFRYDRHVDSKTYDEILYAMEQGFLAGVTGIVRARTGKLGNLKICRVDELM
jgi:hypothetical protein